MGSESKVKFNHETAEQEQARRSYTAGQHPMVVTSVEAKNSKEKPELPGVSYKMLAITFKPLRDANDTTSVVGRGLTNYQCLPFWDEAWDELDYEVPTKEGPMHIQAMLKRNMIIFNESVRDLLSALLPDEVPARPVKVGEGVYQFKGEEIGGGDEYKAANTESKTAAGEAAERLWNEGAEELVGKACFGLIAYQDGSDWPNLKAVSGTQMVDRKTGEELPLVDPSRIMSVRGEDADETTEAVEEEETPAPAKKNGATSKPTASAKTVAAAQKAKGKTASKSARR